RYHKKTKADDTIVIGTVKKLETVYSIDILIKATALLIQRLKEQSQTGIADQIRLKIVGKGPQQQELEKLAEEYHIRHMTEFTGQVPNDQVIDELNQMDIFAAFSRSESFGVAVLEASACELPVVVSDVGGLHDGVQKGECDFVSALDEM